MIYLEDKVKIVSNLDDHKGYKKGQVVEVIAMDDDGMITVEGANGTQWYLDAEEVELVKKGARKFAKGSTVKGGGNKYYVIDAKSGDVVSKGFDTEEEAKVEKYKIFEKNGNFFLTQKKMSKGSTVKGGRGVIVKYDKNSKMWCVTESNGEPIEEYVNKHNAIALAESLNNKYANGGNTSSGYSYSIGGL